MINFNEITVKCVNIATFREGLLNESKSPLNGIEICFFHGPSFNQWNVYGPES